MFKTLVITAFLGLFCMVPARGQTGFLAGTVRDPDTGEPVSFVHVSIDTARYGAISDENGRFLVKAIPPGVHTAEYSRIGYARSFLTGVQIKAADTTHVEIFLESETFIADEVVVTAARKAQALNLAPVSASLLTASQFRQRQIQTFDQALDEVPGVVVTRSSGSNVQSLSIRGASETAGGGIGNRVLLLVDGRPALSPESGGALWTLVPLNSLERIEVVKGAYSALFGSSAMGGVINAITRKPSEKADTRIFLDYGAYSPPPANIDYNQYRDFSTIALSHSRRLGKFSYLIDGSRNQNDGHRQKSGFTLYNLFGKLAYDFARNRSVSLSANFNKIKNDTPATWLGPGRPYEVAAHKLDDYQQKTEGSVDVYYQAITNSDIKYSSRFYYYQNAQLFTFNDDPANDSTNINIGKQFVDSSSIDTWRIGNITQFDWAITSKHYALAGIDIKYDKVIALPDTVLYGRHRAVEFGIYVQDEWTVSPKLTLTGGLRFDYYEIITEFSEINISPKIAFLYQPTKRLSVRGLFARSFRNPSIAERYIKFEQGGGLRFEPNPSLRSEKLVASTELGVKYQLHPELMMDAALYYNNYKDLISFVQVSAPLEPLTFKVVNLKRAVMQGVELGLSYKPCGWFVLRGGYAFLDARDTSPDRINNKLAYKPRHTFSVSTETNYKFLSLFVQVRGRSKIEEVFIYPDSKPRGYVLLDAKLRYSFGKNHDIYLTANNIFNTQYEELERYRMPGMSFSAGVNIRL